jgi:hypothetical protein
MSHCFRQTLFYMILRQKNTEISPGKGTRRYISPIRTYNLLFEYEKQNNDNELPVRSF